MTCLQEKLVSPRLRPTACARWCRAGTGTSSPRSAYEDGGIHEAIADYEDAVFYNILAEELARRDLGLEDTDPEDVDRADKRAWTNTWRSLRRTA